MIICCGEALIDMLPRRLPEGEGAFLPVPGGALFNTAVALGRLGEKTSFLSGISTDMFGVQLIGHLKASRVNTGLTVRSPNPTTLAFVSFEGGSAHYSFFDENSAGRMLTVDQLPDLPADVTALHFGAISLIAEPCGSAYEALATRHTGDVVISLDPNIRPGFVADEAAYRERLRRMIGVSDIIKVSDEDLDWLEPGISFDAAAEKWISSGASLVILTRGVDGCRAVTAREDVEIEAEEVSVVDVVGAGDAFNAGVLAALRDRGFLSKARLGDLDTSALADTMRFAARIAGYTVGRAGANPPWRAEL